MIWEHIHPKARRSFQLLEEDLLRGFLVGETPTWFRPFEGYRAPSRQLDMLNNKTSKALPFQSAHQYGLAVDYVGFVAKGGTVRIAMPTGTGRWTWDASLDWHYLDVAAGRQGLDRSISWDRPHVEHPLWHRIRGYVV